MRRLIVDSEDLNTCASSRIVKTSGRVSGVRALRSSWMKCSDSVPPLGPTVSLRRNPWLSLLVLTAPVYKGVSFSVARGGPRAQRLRTIAQVLLRSSSSSPLSRPSTSRSPPRLLRCTSAAAIMQNVPAPRSAALRSPDRAAEGPQRVAVAEGLPRQQAEPRSGSRSCPVARPRPSSRRRSAPGTQRTTTTNARLRRSPTLRILFNNGVDHTIERLRNRNALRSPRAFRVNRPSPAQALAVVQQPAQDPAAGAGRLQALSVRPPRTLG